MTTEKKPLIVVQEGGRVWLSIAHDGSLAMIDWEIVEHIAASHRLGLRQDPITAVALTALAVREKVLALMPPTPGDLKRRADG